MPPKIAVTGWSRGGLGYVYTLLQAAGCDVGLNFSDITDENEITKKVSRSRTVEVSSGFVPFMLHEAFADTTFYFILRDPMRVLNSLHFLGYFQHEHNSYPRLLTEKYLTGHEPYRGYPSQLICHYLDNWFMLFRDNCYKQYKNREMLRVEAGNERILNRLGIAPRKRFYVPQNVNYSGCKQNIVPSVLADSARATMEKLLQTTGYRYFVWLPRGGHAHYVNPDWHM